MAHSSIQDFIDKLNTIPPQVSKMLHKIRKIDVEALQLHTSIESQRKLALQKAAEYAKRKTSKIITEITQLNKQINKQYKQMMDLSEQKIILAHKLYNLIDEPTEQLDRDITTQTRQKNNGNLEHEIKGKHKRGRKDQQWEYDTSEPCYCYCKRPSFGEMVMCENTYCETQWFHMECIDQKNLLADKWYCRDCKKGKNEKIRSMRMENGVR